MSHDTTDRRTFVKTTAAALAGVTALAGCGGGGNGGGGGTTAGGNGGTPPSFDGWMESVGNYDGVADHTGESEVTVKVGAEGNGGNFAFAPPAIRISTGTTVVWEWTGKGQQHNVVAKDGAYESDLVAEEGHTFDHTFEEAATSKYFCEPHKAVGMKGVVVVE